MSAVLAAAASAGPASGADDIRILALGDSLTAGYRLASDESFPAKLQMALEEGGIKATVVNAGVSGDTTAGGLARLDWMLAEVPDAAIVELGANDALRGVDPAATRANLDAIVTRLKAKGVKVLLAGMLAPPNLGPEFGRDFNGIYPALAEKHGIPLYPFFLEGVATREDLNLDDGKHPNAKGVDVIVESILPYVKRLLGRTEG